jgi:hypothetical protein
MPPPARSPKFWATLFSLGTAWIVAGCNFVPVHHVSVDAISGPVTAVGLGYKLVDKDPMAVRDTHQHKLVYEYVRAALGTKGVFEVPPETKPDFIIEVDYGSSRGPGVTRLAGVAPTTEHFLQLSARRARPDGTAGGKGEEIWNVRTSANEDQVDLSFLLPILAGAAADYAGLDTQQEKTIKVSEKAPGVINLKNTVSGPPPDPKDPKAP